MTTMTPGTMNGGTMNAGLMTTDALLPARVGPLRAVQQTCSLAWRTLVQIKHNPFELMDFSVQPIMFLLLFVYVFGGAISGSPHDYLQYVLAGIIVQNSLFTTLNTAVGLSTDLDKGFSSRLRALPVARFAPLAGRILADVAKQAWAIALLFAAGTIMGFRADTSALAVLAGAGLVLVCTVAFAWALVWIGMLVANPEKVQIFGFVVLFPLTFTSGAFVRTASMPGWLQAFSKANPVTLLADATRGLMAGGQVAVPAVESLLYAAGFVAVFAPLAVMAFRRRV
jgi:oleandomycin transport system permease protein